MDKVLKKKTMSVNFPRALFFRLDFLTLQVGTDRLSWYVSMNFPVCAW